MDLRSCRQRLWRPIICRDDDQRRHHAMSGGSMSSLIERIDTQVKATTAADRRGFALLTVIMLTLGMAALGASAVYLAGNAGLLATSQDREREFKYGAEAAMAIGKSRLNVDPL